MGSCFPRFLWYSDRFTFIFGVLEICDKTKFSELEYKYAVKFRSLVIDGGFNEVVTGSTGSFMSKDYIHSISNKLSGIKPKNWETIQKKVWTKVAMFIDGKFIRHFDSQREAARYTGICYKRINAYLKRGSIIIGHETYTFKYAH